MRGFVSARRIPCELNLDDILEPADAFSHPQEVVCDLDLTINEKRAILASWASDACAVEATPGLRRSPAGATVTFDDIMDALKELDESARKGMKRTPSYRRLMRQSDIL
ncbi:hypothetical protein [Taklimakanibacter deserti]|uniref:hypothetical protein n=1 Tax=Taklimakanibacter deserti TaxID=2267839 RepID=UPI000E65048D